MTAATSLPPSSHRSEATELALRLAHAENALRTLTLSQVDAIVDPDGKTYLLRPAQEHLRKNERRLQAIIDCAADVITVLNRGGEILSTSRAASRVLGCEPEELVGESIFDFIHEEDLPAAHFAFFGVIELFRKEATVQFRHRARDGSWRMIEASVGTMPGAPSVSVVFVMRPVTSPLPAPTPTVVVCA